MKFFYRPLKYFVIFLITCSLLGAASLYISYLIIKPDLPEVSTLKDIKLSVPLRIYTSDNKLIGEFGKKRRAPLKYEKIPSQMINAFLAAEDERFFTHPGVDYQGILRAIWHIIKTGEKGSGGSTITMQVARNFFLTKEKTYIRKLKEIFLSLKIEQEFSKNEIIELYLNRIFLGNRAYGIGAAAQVYYGKPVNLLSLEQAAMIAGLPKAPSANNPISNPVRAKGRRGYVLRRMLKLGFITQEEFEHANKQPISAKLHGQATEAESPYIAEMVRNKSIKQFGDKAYTDGYKVFTTISSDLQLSAQKALKTALINYDMRHGYKGPEGNIPDVNIIDLEELGSIVADYGSVGNLLPAVVTGVDENSAQLFLPDGTRATIKIDGLKWARKYISDNTRGPQIKKVSDVLAPGDLIRVRKEKTIKDDIETNSYILSQVPEVSGAFVAMNPNNGAIIALVGGFDYYTSKFNRVTQAQRQPGSGIKPFIYSAALSKGYTTASLINDAPVVFEDSALENTWRPENYSGHFYGPTRLRDALTFSRNLVSIRLLRAIGTSEGINHLQKFGFSKEQLPNDLSLALGSANVTPLQMVSSYSVIANGGYKVDPYFIDRIEDSNGNIVFSSTPLKVCKSCEASDNNQTSDEDTYLTALATNIAPRVVDERNIYLLTSMMRDVVKRGTARKALVLNRSDLAGKTGTTNDQRDAWFNGFNQDIAATAWVGFDKIRSLGNRETGGKAALPVWIDFMRDALKNKPQVPLKQPAGIITVRIDKKTGQQTNASNPNAIFEIFRAENVPQMDQSSDANETDIITGSGQTTDGLNKDEEDHLF
ncbi:MAG: penicillin-binding protein 1A [Gammaproteobacteria bacterium]|nr:MAG: penicillin-binding protein 1A [Gammaproteobacteria bacterium]